eukprot:CAMPEP_0174755418 /NCGR_PEP_ID=MMETSP1094-20130205/106236_1 /TAXON_ID=156173 /ORGANISM="Chrysochromulina brevifilum, Strain UTEX LB 985" /LENGTH=359 /DNA_ID=CAMNT_0015961307 /DNA_START=26 /DNA_END=1105 /DNA_ORIENTATION=+
MTPTALSLSLLSVSAVVALTPGTLAITRATNPRHSVITATAPSVAATNLVANVVSSVPQEERKVELAEQEADEQAKAQALLQKVKEAGLAGGLSYFVVELTFFAVALPIGYYAWHASTGEWLQPLFLLEEDGAEGKVRLLGLILSYIVLLKSLFPLRLGATLLLTPRTKGLLERLDLLNRLPAMGGAASRRAGLTTELLDLAAVSRGGLDPLTEEQQQGFDAIVEELSGLSPVADPALSATLSGEWQCVWTTEQELLFLAKVGLFGCEWERTYQTIDVEAGTLENVVQFAQGSSLTVESTFDPDESITNRFNFRFRTCEVRWRAVQLPLPPVGAGWGELLYLDERMRQLPIPHVRGTPS